MNDNLTIRSLWIGSDLSRLEHLCIKSYLYYGHRFELFVYNPNIKNVPSGAHIMDANEIIEEKNIFKSQNSFALFSDWFRFKLLHDYGGIWVDMDLICLKRFDFQKQVVLCGEHANILSTGFIKLPKKSEVSRKMLDRVKNSWQYAGLKSFPEKVINRLLLDNYRKFKFKPKRFEDLYNYISWGAVAGPKGFTKVLKESDVDSLVLNPQVMYPIKWQSWLSIFYEPIRDVDPGLGSSYAIHLWANKYKTHQGFSKNGPFKKGSIIDHLLTKYEVEKSFE